MKVLEPLREPNFRWYALARLTNQAGGSMYPVALAFAVLDVDDSPSALGRTLAAQSIPLVAFLLLGGVIADRFGRARVLRITHVLAGVSQGVLAYLVLTDRVTLALFMAFAAVLGVSSAIAFPALASVVPQLVPRSQLQQANVLMSMIRGALTVIGPSIAAVLVVTVGPGWALAVDACTWLLAAVLLLRVRIPPPQADTESAGMLTELREGWTFFRRTTWLWAVVLAFAALNAIHSGAWFTLGPARAKETFGESGWGLALSAEAVGLLVLTAIMARARLERPLLLGMLGVSCFAAPLLVLGAAPHLVLLVVAAFVAGAGMELFSLGWNLAMQEHIDDRMLSRAYSYDALGSFVAIPIGQLGFGLLGATFDTGKVIVVAGVGYAAIALLTLSSTSVRRLRRVVDQVSTTSSPAS